MATYNLHERIIDPVSGHLSSYFCRLYIMVRKDTIDYCLLDTEKNKFIAVNSFNLQSAGNEQEKSYAAIKNLFSGEELLKKKYPLVVIGIESPYQTLVPESFYDEQKISGYLKLNFILPEYMHFFSDEVEEAGACNVCAVPLDLKELIQHHFEKATLVHQSTAVLKSFFQNAGNSTTPSSLFLNVRVNDIDLALFEGKRFMYFNSFPWQNKEDMLYFTLYFIDQAARQPDRLNLFISGNIDVNSDAVQLLKNYFVNLDFSPGLNAFEYSPLLEQLPRQRYNDLYALALCGS